VYSGVIRAGSSVLNTSKGRRERVGRVVRMFADRREDVEEGARRRHRRNARL